MKYLNHLRLLTQEDSAGALGQRHVIINSNHLLSLLADLC